MHDTEEINAVRRNPPAGLLRRLAAIVYDWLLLVGVLFLVSLPLPLIDNSISQTWWIRLLTQLYLFATCLLFFCWFWVHEGQTLGMRAWRLKVVQPNGAGLSWRLALIRFFGAILSWLVLGLGFLWVLFDKDKKAWHDHLSGTKLIVEPKAEQFRTLSSLNPRNKVGADAGKQQRGKHRS